MANELLRTLHRKLRTWIDACFFEFFCDQNPN